VSTEPAKHAPRAVTLRKTAPVRSTFFASTPSRLTPSITASASAPTFEASTNASRVVISRPIRLLLASFVWVTIAWSSFA
jgi:hypothetical protein